MARVGINQGGRVRRHEAFTCQQTDQTHLYGIPRWKLAAPLYTQGCERDPYVIGLDRKKAIRSALTRALLRGLGERGEHWGQGAWTVSPVGMRCSPGSAETEPPLAGWKAGRDCRGRRGWGRRGERAGGVWWSVSVRAGLCTPTGRAGQRGAVGWMLYGCQVPLSPGHTSPLRPPPGTTRHCSQRPEATRAWGRACYS